MKCAIIQVDANVFRELFGLPDTAEVVAVECDIETRSVLLLKVIGAGVETPEGGSIPRFTPAIRKMDNWYQVLPMAECKP